MSSIYDWSSTPGSNTSVGGVNIAEGMSPALVNDAIRAALSIIVQTFAASLQNFLNGTSPLAVASGGTGATTAAAALTALGALSSVYRDLPIITKSGAFAFADSERSSGINFNGSSPATGTISPYASVPITVGAAYVIYNSGSAALTITRGAGVFLSVNAGTASADTVLAPGGIANLTHWGNDVWKITGAGLS